MPSIYEVTRSRTLALARLVLSLAAGVALILAAVVVPVAIGNAHHDSACVALTSEGDRLACLNRGTPAEHAIAQCGTVMDNGGSAGAFDQCVAIALGRPYAASGAQSSAAASSSGP